MIIISLVHNDVYLSSKIGDFNMEFYEEWSILELAPSGSQDIAVF